MGFPAEVVIERIVTMKACIITFFVALLLMGCGGGLEPADIRIGGSLPEFTLPALEGGDYTSSQTSDKPVIVNFWATWCQPCQKEIPALKTLHEQNKADVIAIALDKGGAPPVKRFVKKNKLDYKILLGNEEIFAQFKGYGIPYTLILDRQGKIVNIHRSPASLEELEADIASANGPAEVHGS